MIIPTDKYNKNIHILTDTIGLGQFNESHDVCLFYVTQYANCRVSKMDMRFPSRNSTKRCVMVEDDST